jgi:hypothetical protein
MVSMNTDSAVNTTSLGLERPSLQGPYYFNTPSCWDGKTFKSMVGVKGQNAWDTLLKTNTYIELNGVDTKDG